MKSIIKNNYNQLVIAGAGCGKTTTIAGKIKYLLKTEKYKPNEILVLSFTNASANEMKNRIISETNCNIETSTFHKLGLNIITEVEKNIPKISQLNLRKFIKEQIFLQPEEYLNLLNSYILYNRIIYKSEFEFNSQEEYEEYLKLNQPTTINNEKVKSYGEMDIANFLIQNKIKYCYEYPYKEDTYTNKYKQYCPDFYLPDYDIYIEYYGINKDGKVPDYFKSKNNTSATEEYQKSIKWKRETHKKNKTTLIECYAYEKFDGVLLKNLEKKLINNNVQLNKLNQKELWEVVSSSNNEIIEGIIELFETIINLMKSNGYNITTLQQLNINNNNIINNNIIIKLIEPIYNSYCNYLKEHNEIDFNDMINKATQYVEEKKYINPYKYIIVDEYQDISKARYSLLNSMRKSNDYKLFCVGDDWQSIYRFAGSDINFIINFEKYWGTTEINKIETTYRFNQKLIDISSNFIMKNPNQIIKNIKGTNNTNNFPLGEINIYTEDYIEEFTSYKLDDLPKNSTIFFIGRYSFDIKSFTNNYFKCKYNNINNVVEVTYLKRQDLKINYITAHKSKGLQADYVFIINNKNSRMGFPSKVQDSPILNLLLENYDNYPYSEERRLFYVALTRAKKKVYMVTIDNQESKFVNELKKQYNDELKKEQWECPLCGGRLHKIKGQYGNFLGCSNYRTNGCKYKRKINSN